MQSHDSSVAKVRRCEDRRNSTAKMGMCTLLSPPPSCRLIQTKPPQPPDLRYPRDSTIFASNFVWTCAFRAISRKIHVFSLNRVKIKIAKHVSAGQFLAWYQRRHKLCSRTGSSTNVTRRRSCECEQDAGLKKTREKWLGEECFNSGFRGKRDYERSPPPPEPLSARKASSDYKHGPLDKNERPLPPTCSFPDCSPC